MAQKEKVEDTASKVSIAELMLSHVRYIELQARLLLLASAFDGFQMQSQDCQAFGVLLTTWADRVKKTLSKEA